MRALPTVEQTQRIAAHESPRTTKLCARTTDQVTLDEIERIAIQTHHAARQQHRLPFLRDVVLRDSGTGNIDRQKQPRQKTLLVESDSTRREVTDRLSW